MADVVGLLVNPTGEMVTRAQAESPRELARDIIELRHGLGKLLDGQLGDLTRRMARKDLTQLERDFRRIDVEIEGRSIRVSDAAVRRAAMSGRSFIEWLDNQLMGYDHGLTAP